MDNHIYQLHSKYKPMEHHCFRNAHIFNSDDLSARVLLSTFYDNVCKRRVEITIYKLESIKTKLPIILEKRSRTKQLYVQQRNNAEKLGRTGHALVIQKSLNRHQFFFNGLLRTARGLGLQKHNRMKYKGEQQHPVPIVNEVSLDGKEVTDTQIEDTCVKPDDEIAPIEGTCVDPEEEITPIEDVCVDPEEEISIAREDFDLLCIVLQTLIYDLIDVWKAVKDGSTSVATAGASRSFLILRVSSLFTTLLTFIVTNCIYAQIDSHISAAQVLNPHWLVGGFLESMDYFFKEDYEQMKVLFGGAIGERKRLEREMKKQQMEPQGMEQQGRKHQKRKNRKRKSQRKKCQTRDKKETNHSTSNKEATNTRIAVLEE